MRPLSSTEVLPGTDITAEARRPHERVRALLHAHPRGRRMLAVAGVLAAALSAALLAFALFAHTTYQVGPARIYVGAAPALSGSTKLSLPPFGSVSAETHASPVAVTAELQEVDLARLQELAAQGLPSEATVAEFRQATIGGVTRAVAKGVVAALLAAAFVTWALRRPWREVAGAAILGLVVPSLMVTAAYTGFRPEAFRDPTYEGAVAYAPSLIGLVQGRFDRVGKMQEELGQTVRELSSYYDKPQSFAAGGKMPNTMRVLQVSDLHLDPIGFQLTSDLADEFDVSFILDAGDVNTYGTPLEASVATRFLDTRRPRVFVPGNHESSATVAAIAALPGVTVLDPSRPVDIAGLRILGVADPSGYTDGWEPDNRAVAEASKRAFAAATSAEGTGSVPPTSVPSISAAEPTRTPDIVVTHNPAGQKVFEGYAPLLVSGHTHTQALGRRGKSWYVNSGTVGGVHFSKLRSDPHIPHGASILYYTETMPRRLVAIDQIEVWGTTGQTSLKRTVVDPSLLEDIGAVKSSGR